MNIIQLRTLQGYDEELEQARQEKFNLFWATDDKDEQREALRSHASLTSLRSKPFIAAIETLKGLRDD